MQEKIPFQSPGGSKKAALLQFQRLAKTLGHWFDECSELGGPTATLLSVAVATLILLLPTFANGFPFVSWDTGTYLESAVRLRVPHDRPVYYSIFAALLHWKTSPWPIVVAQSALIAALIGLVARSVFGIRNPLAIASTALILACASSLPWFVGQIMPDIFTGVLVLAILVLTFGWHRLQTSERWFTLLLIPACISFHNANLLVALAAGPALGAMSMVGWRPGPQGFRRFFMMAVAAALGVVALMSANVIAHGKFTLSSGSPVFLFAKLLDDGPALEVLESECPGAGYAVCNQLDGLREYKSRVSDLPGAGSLTDHFLWEGPLESLGWFSGFEPEAIILTGKALRRLSWKQAELSLGHAASQFIHVATGDGLISFAPDVQPSPAIRWTFGESVYSSYFASEQQNGMLDFALLNSLHGLALVISALAMLGMAAMWWRTDKLALYITIFTLMFLVGNATIMGILSAVHDRYQSRIIWLVPLFAVLGLMRSLSSAEPVIRSLKVVSRDCDFEPSEFDSEQGGGWSRAQATSGYQTAPMIHRHIVGRSGDGEPDT
jgi:hypothetical protein